MIDVGYLILLLVGLFLGTATSLQNGGPVGKAISQVLVRNLCSNIYRTFIGLLGDGNHLLQRYGICLCPVGDDLLNDNHRSLSEK